MSEINKENSKENSKEKNKEKEHEQCSVCKKKFPHNQTTPLSTVRDSLINMIKKNHPDIDSDEGYICQNDLNRVRREYFQQLIKEEKGDLTEVENAVVDALQEHEVLSSYTSPDSINARTFGERLSDQIALFGGSWIFIILFGVALSIWILWNSITAHRFDPYPYILLNLFLSCLAAIQAPIIMMSQNRQQARDRQHQEQDYKVNLKSEVEIRVLNEKIDKLISHQWQRLLEIQEMQMDFMEEITSHKHK